METENGKISVIIPTFNRQNFVKECIESVINQSYQNFEIIIIDDGSSDKTVEICEELSKTEPRIRLYISEHCGVSAARNKALEKAAGEYVFFLDSDDIIHPLLFETLICGLKNNDAAIAGTEVINFLEKNHNKVLEIMNPPYIMGETTYQTHEESLEAMFTKTSPLSLIGGIMMRRDLIGDTKFKTDIFIGEDFYFIYENLIKGASTVFLKQKWYYCRIHSNNSSFNFTYSGFWTRFHRRELVWKSEEAFGRTKYANIQKTDAFNSFLACMNKNKPYSKDARLMRKTVKKYRRIIFPALSKINKLKYCLYIYLPFAKKPIYKLETSLKKLKHRN